MGRARQPGRGRGLLAGRGGAETGPWSRSGCGRARALAVAGGRRLRRSVALASMLPDPRTPDARYAGDPVFELHRGGKMEIALHRPARRTRRPVHGLHAGRGAGVRGDRRGAPAGRRLHLGLQHRRGRHRRHRRARAWATSARGRDAGHGGQGGAVQAVRRRGRRPDLPGHHGRRRDRRDRRPAGARASAASTSRTSRRRAASRSSERLKELLDIPVFHDDQHGTAVVALAALENALRLTGRYAEPPRVVISGAGAAGVAVTRILLAAGVTRPRRHRPPGRAPLRPRRPHPGQAVAGRATPPT